LPSPPAGEHILPRKAVVGGGRGAGGGGNLGGARRQKTRASAGTAQERGPGGATALEGNSQSPPRRRQNSGATYPWATYRRFRLRRVQARSRGRWDNSLDESPTRSSTNGVNGSRRLEGTSILEYRYLR